VRLTTEGRANPKSTLCLYLVDKKDTAMAEVRPWLESYITLTKFKTNKELNLVNCTVKPSKHIHLYFKEPNNDEKEKAVWRDINRAFSKPVDRDETTIDYLPTQKISDLYKLNRYDGLIYRSMLEEGLNIALFDINAADCIDKALYQLKNLNFDFKPDTIDIS
jgi:RES domain